MGLAELQRLDERLPCNLASSKPVPPGKITIIAVDDMFLGNGAGISRSTDVGEPEGGVVCGGNRGASEILIGACRHHRGRKGSLGWGTKRSHAQMLTGTERGGRKR